MYIVLIERAFLSLGKLFLRARWTYFSGVAKVSTTTPWVWASHKFLLLKGSLRENIFFLQSIHIDITNGFFNVKLGKYILWDFLPTEQYYTKCWVHCRVWKKPFAIFHSRKWTSLSHFQILQHVGAIFCPLNLPTKLTITKAMYPLLTNITKNLSNI